MTTDGIRERATVYIRCSDELLRLALARRLSALAGLRVVADGTSSEWTGPGVVVAPAADITPGECSTLLARRLVPFVLAAIPNDEQRAAFEATGAIYMAMDLEAGDLITALSLAPMPSTDAR